MLEKLATSARRSSSCLQREERRGQGSLITTVSVDNSLFSHLLSNERRTLEPLLQSISISPPAYPFCLGCPFHVYSSSFSSSLYLMMLSQSSPRLAATAMPAPSTGVPLLSGFGNIVPKLMTGER